MRSGFCRVTRVTSAGASPRHLLRELLRQPYVRGIGCCWLRRGEPLWPAVPGVLLRSRRRHCSRRFHPAAANEVRQSRSGRPPGGTSGCSPPHRRTSEDQDAQWQDHRKCARFAYSVILVHSRPGDAAPCSMESPRGTRRHRRASAESRGRSACGVRLAGPTGSRCRIERPSRPQAR